MRCLLILVLAFGMVGCRSEISESEDIDTLTATPDGSVLACVQRFREYANGFADCCDSTVDFTTILLDASGQPNDRNDTRGCPGYDSITAIQRTDAKIPLADGGALLIHEDTRGERCDVSAIDSAGATRIKLDWRNGSIAWSATVHAF